jgi:hydroxymethylpyrimidine/phosphomethylpyrimidine kinase
MEEKEQILGNLCLAIGMLQKSKSFGRIIPEVRTNIVFCLRNAKGVKDVAGIEGRITKIEGRPHPSGYPKFGASDHLARKILEIRKYNPEFRSAINFVYNEKLGKFLKKYCKERGIIYGCIDRSKEPERIAKKEKLSMPWKVAEAIKSAGEKIPEIFYEANAPGKEDLTVIIGKSATEVAKKAIEIAELFYNEVC